MRLKIIGGLACAVLLLGVSAAPADAQRRGSVAFDSSTWDGWDQGDWDGGWNTPDPTPEQIAEWEATTMREIGFPTETNVTFTDDFGDARSGGRTHEGNDLMGAKMTPLYATVNGTIASINIPEESWGYALTIRDADGWTYHYLHINNDTPGTDDGAGGEVNAYAPGIARGATVTKGQLVGWMGDSGNAESAGAHLHFEMRRPDGIAISPYVSLRAALVSGPGTYSPEVARLSAATINADRSIVAVSGAQACESGSLIKSPATSAVYYCGADGKRYVFPHERVYFSWYTDFDDVMTVTEEELAAAPLGGLVTYRPGSYMVKIESLPNVYAIEAGGVLRWIRSSEVAAALYGSNWKTKVHDVSDAFFGSYTFGEDITSAAAVAGVSTTIPTPAEVEAAVRAAFADVPAMIPIAKCESGFRQFTAAGEVLRGGTGGGYIGVFQIGEAIHATAAANAGMDIYTLQGNLDYARVLYEQSGTRPWKSCL